MGLNRLKYVRIPVSLLFPAVISLSFADFRNFMPVRLTETFTYLQLIPSLLKLSAGFLIVLIVTAIFGRVYCSSVCPLGTLQDCLSHRRNRKYKYLTPHNRLRYGILAVTALAFAAGSSLLMNLLDPFSTFGRIFSNLFRPAVIWLNNFTAPVLESRGVLLLYRVQWGEPVVISIIISFAVLLLIVWMSAKYGRLYCNTLCPVGALLGLIARVSVFKIAIKDGSCTSCGRCEKVCKAGCISAKEKTVDMSRCVSCFNCFGACGSDGLYYRSFRQADRKPVERSRRKFMADSSALFAAVVLPGAEIPVKEIKQSRPTTVPVVRTSPVSPPGSKSISSFTTRCTACHLCVSACPTRVLIPSVKEFGLHGLLQPHMGFDRGHCNYECSVCIDICPTDAIQPVSLDEKKLTQVGEAKFIKENCVVETDKTACGACSEHCPTKAVEMVPYKNDVNDKLTIPEMHKELCIGCGGCEHACPTKPYKAIFVDGKPVHTEAKKPKIEKLEQKVDLEADFPF